jgi:hypothetical protein
MKSFLMHENSDYFVYFPPETKGSYFPEAAL